MMFKHINQRKFIKRKYSNEANVKSIKNQLFAFTKFVQDVKNIKVKHVLSNLFKYFWDVNVMGRLSVLS